MKYNYTNIKILSFAHGKFLESQQLLNQHLDTLSINNRINLTSADLSQDFQIQYADILKFPRGYGYCIWKPYIIYDQLQKINHNEILLYIDSTDLPKKSFFDFVLDYFNNNQTILLLNRGYNNGIWTKRDTFVLMECDSDYYHNAVQLEAGIIGLTQTTANLDLINEWFHHCVDGRKLTEEPNICGLKNLKKFKEHRYDQSILTNLCLQKQLITSYNLDNSYISYNHNQPK